MILDIGLTLAHALDPVAFAEDRLGFRPDSGRMTASAVFEKQAEQSSACLLRGEF